MSYIVRAKQSIIKQTLIFMSVTLFLCLMSDGWFSAVNAIFAILSLCLFFIHDHSIILTIDEYGIKYISKDKEINVSWENVRKIKYRVKSRFEHELIILSSQSSKEMILSLDSLYFDYIPIRLVREIKRFIKRNDILEYNKYQVFLS